MDHTKAAVLHDVGDGFGQCMSIMAKTSSLASEGGLGTETLCAHFSRLHGAYIMMVETPLIKPAFCTAPVHMCDDGCDLTVTYTESEPFNRIG
jgi:hypothetical protein